MAKNFEELSERVKGTWSDNARRVYETASSVFIAEMGERAELGAALAAARKSRALTQPVLAELTGIQQAEISRIERGIGNPTAATLMCLANGLGYRFALVPDEA